MKLDDVLNSITKISGTHMNYMIIFTSLLVPFVSTTLVFFPDYVKDANVLMYLLLGVVSGFFLTTPTYIIGLALERRRSKKISEVWMLSFPLAMLGTLGWVWGMIATIYYLFFLDYGFDVYMMIMASFTYVSFPLGIIGLYVTSKEV